MALDWQGKKLTEKFRRAQVTGIEATMAAAAIHAKRNHPWINDTGELERSIGIIEHAKQTGRGARGLWGSQGIIYALILELGGQAGRALATTIPAFPYLIPAADAQYPGLAGRIRKAFVSGGKRGPLPPRSAKVEEIISGAVGRFEARGAT